ncbi:hypothetical protein D3H65_10530 [Paraflavitalea soli]|uniref:DUF4397 domain-containing protein n=1 Tax=Paraflavitalea soli TaxID=2315862 RepID=A0A3B7MN83_9BACT|nr:hypothetical protein [Paraflavitalea soli]AXY74386.1 hypothetical protein D3H65_10530 [Paraflavitalea soli]
MTNRSFAVLLILFLSGACSKKGEPVVQAKFTNLSLRAITNDPFTLKIVADENTVLTEALEAPGGTSNVTVEYYDLEHRFQVYNLFGNELLLDTIVRYKPGFVNGITFFQAAAGAKLVWVGPPQNEPLAKEGYFKLSIVYNLNALPDSVRVVVENSITSGGQTYAPTDSFTLKKGEFSRYFEGRSGDRKANVRFYSTTSPRRVLAEAISLHYSANPDFSVYLLGTASNASIPYSFIPVKIY